jgi:hypothetical protein
MLIKNILFSIIIYDAVSILHEIQRIFSETLSFILPNSSKKLHPITLFSSNNLYL